MSPLTQTIPGHHRRSAIAELHSDWHRELKAVLEDVLALAGRRQFATAAKRFGEFRLAHERHVREEEEFLLPYVERMGEAEVGLAKRIRLQHAQMTDLISELSTALNAWDAKRCEEVSVRLRRAQAEHHEVEEKALPSLQEPRPTSH